MTRIVNVFVLNVLLTLAILLALEIGSRLVLPTELPDPLVPGYRGEWTKRRIYDRLLFWRMRPNIVVEQRQITNGLGLRGPEIPAKDPGEFRILSLGESTTYARRIPYEQTYSSVLEQRLATLDGKRVRVINAGVPGYSIVQGYSFLRHRGLDLQIDAVITYFGYNDFLRVAYRERREGEAEAGGLTDRRLLELRESFRYRLLDFLRRYSNLARLPLRRHGAADPRPPTRSKRPRVPEADRRWALERIRSLCREHGLRLAVVIPWYREFTKHVPLLRELSSWEEVVVVDLPKRMSLLAGANAHLFLDPVHPNAEGHRLIAEAIAAELRESWQTPEAP